MVEHRCKDCVYYSLKKEPGQTTAMCLRKRSTRIAFGKSGQYCTGFMKSNDGDWFNRKPHYCFANKPIIVTEQK